MTKKFTYMQGLLGKATTLGSNAQYIKRDKLEGETFAEAMLAAAQNREKTWMHNEAISSNGEAVIDLFQIKADQGGPYLISFNFCFSGTPAANTFPFSVQSGSSGTLVNYAWYFQINTTTPNLEMHDSNNTLIGSAGPLTPGQVYHFEMFWEKGSSASYAWYLDGTLEGSGSTANLSPTFQYFRASNNGYNYGLAWADLVFQDGVASATERLGTGHRCHALLPDYRVTPQNTQGGDTLDAGSMWALFRTGTDPKFTANGSEKSRWIEWDGHYLFEVYFDASGSGPTDPQAVWGGESTAFDNNLTTTGGANTITVGSTSTNYLFASGVTDVPDFITDNAAIDSVQMTLTGRNVTAGSFSAAVYTASKAQLLGTTQNTSLAGTNVRVNGAVLSTPTGGWTWAKLQALEVYVYKDASAGDSSIVERIGLFIYYDLDVPSGFASGPVPASTIDFYTTG
jgi:NAD(P)-dependent dehydrogenase (short-subunit alcohol dehydrogenase family)